MIKYKSPLLVVKNIKKSKKFYEKILEQKVKNDEGGFVFLESGFVIQSQENFEKTVNKNKTHTVKYGSNNFELYFESKNFDETYNRLKKEKINFLHKPKKQSWGQRVLRFYDPDKHIIEIGETMESVIERLYKEGYNRERIANKSSIPKNYIDKTIKKLN